MFRYRVDRQRIRCCKYAHNDPRGKKSGPRVTKGTCHTGEKGKYTLIKFCLAYESSAYLFGWWLFILTEKSLNGNMLTKVSLHLWLNISGRGRFCEVLAQCGCSAQRGWDGKLCLCLLCMCITSHRSTLFLTLVFYIMGCVTPLWPHFRWI